MSGLVTIDVESVYGITFNGVSQALANASQVLEGGDSCTLLFSAGTHDIDMPYDLFNLTGLAAPVGGRLTIAGAGMLLTTLNITTHGNTVIKSKGGLARFTIRDLTFARPAQTTTQGTIVALDQKSITIKIAQGFPSLAELLIDRYPRLKAEQGLYLKRFRSGFADGPHIVTGNGEWPPTVNNQVHFTCGDVKTCPDIKSVGKSLWKLNIPQWGSEQAHYKADMGVKNALVGVKIKHGGQSMYIRQCKDVAFESVRWLGHSRGILIDCDDVVLRHTRVERLSKGDTLATPGGGPQINTCTNLTIFNHTSVGTGDDSLGLFQIKSGSVTGCHIRDSFARGILLQNVSDGFFKNVHSNEVIRCPVYRP
jgi:hypothetical protein